MWGAEGIKGVSEGNEKEGRSRGERVFGREVWGVVGEKVGDFYRQADAWVDLSLEPKTGRLGSNTRAGVSPPYIPQGLLTSTTPRKYPEPYFHNAVCGPKPQKSPSLRLLCLHLAKL